MQHHVSVQPTPNPNALKFVLNTPVKNTESAVFRASRRDDAQAVPLAAALLALEGVVEVYFSGSFITVTQNGTQDWDVLEAAVKNTILEQIAAHDPDFQPRPLVEERSRPQDGELARIEQILDGTIRPALQHDGGDLEIVRLDGKVLTISYQGACGSCSHAAMGTLYAIQNILRDQYDPELVVEMA